MKKTLLLFFVMLISFIGFSQEISLGSGTTADISPVNKFYRNSFNQQIFTKEEINADGAGVITALKFYGSDLASFTNTANIKFWIGHTSKSSFTSTTDWISLDNLTLIHDGLITRAGGVTTINISGGFNYNNVDNIVIVGFKEATSNDSGSTSRFYNYTGGSNTVLYKDIDTPTSTNPHVTLSNYTTITGSRSTKKSRITFVGLTPNSIPRCPNITAPITNATNVSVLPTISWVASDGATSYNVKVGTTSGGFDVINETGITATSYTVTNELDFLTTYYLTVEAVGVGGASSDCSVRQFTTKGAPPINDNCENAIPLSVNPNLLYNVVTSGTTLNATMTMAAGNCGGTPSDDVWFSFVATNTEHQIQISNRVAVGTTTSSDTYFQVLSGQCGNFTSLLCSDPDVGVVTNLTIGETYYIRVYTWSSNVNIAATFDIGIGTAIQVPVPSNDECDNAVSLTVNPDYNYAITTSGSTASATQSSGATSCSITPDDDVWFSFVATSSSHQIRISDVVSVGLSSTTNMYFQVLEGSCNQFTSLLCSDPNTNLVTNLTIGNTYFIRVYTYSQGVQYACNFNIGIGTPPPPPTNDECENAISLTPGGNFNDNYLVGSNSSATNNTNIEAPTCEGYNFDINGKDVWYKVIIPASGTLTLETKNNGDSSMTDTGMSAYSGSCGNLTLIECDADDSLDGNFSLINLTGRTPGEEILVRVWGYNTNEGSFKISAYDATLSAEDFNMNSIKLYPNPFTNQLTISNVENIVNVIVTDMSGKVVKSFKNPTNTLELSELSSGIYMVTLQDVNGSKQTLKAIKK